MKYSIIIVAYGAFDYLDRCLDSLFPTREDQDCELIIVDNTPGERSLDERKLLLQADKLYADGKNHGFAEGCNIGARMASGEYLVFLNPDAEVYGDWLGGMQKHFTLTAGDQYRSAVGAVGPISNFVAGLQRMDFHMQPAEDPAETAARAAEVLAGRGIESKLLIGFCLMVPREVWDIVGGMDPALFLGNDDLDLSWRLRQAGYDLLIATDVFVYHAGHKSFETRPRAEVKKLLRESEEHLRKKLLAHYEGNPPSAVELWGVNFMNTQAVRPLKVSVSMIVRDEEENLKALLPQLAFADEIVIVETNPNRNTGPKGRMIWAIGWAPSVADKIKFGHFPWVDDFAAARNHALSLCTGDYVLWLDADDRVPEKAAALIRANMDRPGPSLHNRRSCIRFQVEDIGPDGRVRNQFSQPRMFPNVEGITWQGRLHESIVPAAQALGLDEIPTDITIQHTGYADLELVKAKAARNFRILSMEPPSPAKHWNLGNAHGMLGEWEKALEEYQKVLQGRWPEPLQATFRDHVRYLAARVLGNLGRIKDAAFFVEENMHPDAHFMLGRVLEAHGDRLGAIAAFRFYLDLTGKPVFWPYDSDYPTLRPAAYAGMFLLLEEEFQARQAAFKTEYPHLVQESAAG